MSDDTLKVKVREALSSGTLVVQPEALGQVARRMRSQIEELDQQILDLEAETEAMRGKRK